MEALAAPRHAEKAESLRISILPLPRFNVSWIRIEFVLLTGALIMGG